MPLKGMNFNVDYRGRLSLCPNISGYRGAAGEGDVVADLKVESFADAYAKLLVVAREQDERRKAALAELARRGVRADLYVGSPCLFCLQSFKKIPWSTGGGRSLPVMPAETAAAV
jgi:hypothetical protein